MVNLDIAELSDIQSESGIIGTVIFHPDFIAHADYFKEKYFYGVENGCIYWAIQELYKDGIENIDANNISVKLNSNKAVEKTISSYNLPDIQESVELYKSQARDTLEEYEMLVQNVTTFAFKREYVKSLNRLILKGYDKDVDLISLNDYTYTALENLTQQFVASQEVKMLGESIDDVWDEIVSRRTDNGLYGLPSKYPLLNNYFTYEPGSLVVIQAKYKEGKSVFLMNEAVHKLRNGVPTLVIDTEMSTREYVERLISHLTGISARNVKCGDYGQEEAEIIRKCIQWIKDQPFVHMYMPEVRMEEVYSICKMLKYKMDLSFVIFDYLKSNEISTGDNYNDLGAKCNFLKNRVAGELDLAVASAAQLNRNGQIADSFKINMYISTGIKWGKKSNEMIMNDGPNCGNAYAKIYVNRHGTQMQEDDDSAYIDFVFDEKCLTIQQAKQQHYTETFF